MSSFSSDGICDVCKRPMAISDSRIEWGYGDSTSTMSYIHICHNDCCNDWNNRGRVGGDIIFDQWLMSDPDFVYERLQEKKEDYPDFADDITRISAIVFE